MNRLTPQEIMQKIIDRLSCCREELTKEEIEGIAFAIWVCYDSPGNRSARVEPFMKNTLTGGNNENQG